jgi:hypothetical protein
LQDKVMAQKLIMEHEMGELFKVIGFQKVGEKVDGTVVDKAGTPWLPIGFSHGDRTHTL